MWDRPDLLNRIANGLFALAALLVAYGARLGRRAPAGVRAARRSSVTGDAQPRHARAGRGDRRRTSSRARSSRSTCRSVRRAFEKLPWVREVKLRRHWPDRLEVSVVEHVPLARWGNDGAREHAGRGLPGRVRREAAGLHRPARARRRRSRSSTNSSAAISRALGTTPVLVQVTPRRAWQVKLEGGPTLELGREDVEARLARYLDVHERTVGALEAPHRLRRSAVRERLRRAHTGAQGSERSRRSGAKRKRAEPQGASSAP